tara:strand:- start:1382 stop:1795 length:414 start_codon:yes stop_codon:yes gene_type:complete
LNSKISDKDKKDWIDFLSNNETLTDKDENFKKQKIKKSFSFDLHGYSLDEANKKIKSIVWDAYENGISKLIIVTGKGLHSTNEKDPYKSKNLGILKYSVPEYLKNNKELMNMINYIDEAKIQDGGSGAFYIYLKKKL